MANQKYKIEDWINTINDNEGYIQYVEIIPEEKP